MDTENQIALRDNSVEAAEKRNKELERKKA
jgi:hypothetical protein